MDEKSFTSTLELCRRLIEFQTTVDRLEEREAIIQYCLELIDPRARVSVKRFKKILCCWLRSRGKVRGFVFMLTWTPWVVLRRNFVPK